MGMDCVFTFNTRKTDQDVPRKDIDSSKSNALETTAMLSVVCGGHFGSLPAPRHHSVTTTNIFHANFICRTRSLGPGNNQI